MSANAKMVEQMYSPEQVAALLGCSRVTVWRWVAQYQESGGRDGIGPVHKLGRRITRIPASAVNRFTASREVRNG